jgi:hypothetical protein
VDGIGWLAPFLFLVNLPSRSTVGVPESSRMNASGVTAANSLAR